MSIKGKLGRTQLKNFTKQVLRFIGLSGMGWVLDFFTYMGLGIISDNLVINNIISSWVGVTFVFTLATRKVFSNKGSIPLGWKYAAYLLYQCGLIYFISRLLNVLNSSITGYLQTEFFLKLSPVFAKILVTPVTMILNFFIMKGIIEKL